MLDKIKHKVDQLQRVDHTVYKRYNAFQKLFKRLSRLLPDASFDQLKVLEIGAGYYYPHQLLFNRVVQSVAGLDVIPVFWRDGMGAHCRHSVAAGRPWHKAIGSTAFSWVKGQLYYRELERLAGHPLSHKSVTVHSYDGLHFPFSDEHFDCVVSHAVLEHVMDIPAVARECARVLRPGGVIDMIWHNYYSFSGNHMGKAVNLQFPWGHLTGDIDMTDAPLNRVRPEQVEEAFATGLQVLRVVGTSWDHCIQGEDDCFEYEAEELLTDERYQALSIYPKDLLLTVDYLIQARKV